MPDTKPFHRSKTLWLNLAGIAVTVLESAEFTNIIPQDWVQFIPVVVLALNIPLRAVTNQGVTLK